MEKLVIDHLVDKSREGSYYSVPFCVPEGVRSLTVRCSYPKQGSVIDLGLEDGQGQFLGWSGSSREYVTVGEFDATPGYLMEPVRAGTWHILVGAYHVREGGVQVRYEVTFDAGGKAWLFGDLHVHSDASDGQHDIPTLARMAKKEGLDFLAVTNHNNYSENFFLPRVPGLTLIPGTEWTHYRGHMNFLGIQKPFTGSFVANDLEGMRAITRQARERGALISANHPRCNVCPYLWEDEDSFQLVEVWNGPMRKINRDGIAWWTELLRKGKKVWAVGGSDFHRDRGPVRVGNPVTAVYSDSPSAKDILSAVARGRCYVTSGVRGIRLGMTCGGETFGGTVTGGAPYVLEVSAQRMPLGTVLQVVGSSSELARFRAKGGSVRETLEVSGEGFAYLLAGVPLRNGEIWPLAVSNPIFFGE
ncbi:MAG: CehA/McbA family metallohydrolase [Candidatus Faecousia sp.]|nr:CehA/McbA family metallohydrolase [Candidatus Faecousia sp.]